MPASTPIQATARTPDHGIGQTRIIFLRMEGIMRKHILFATVVMSLLTIACNGGGGGGGGGSAVGGGGGSVGGTGGGGGSVSVNAAPPVEYSIFVAPETRRTETIETDGNINNPADDYVHIYRDAEGLVIQYRDVANRDLLSDSQTLRTVRFSTGAGASPNSFISAGEYLKATARTTDAVNSVSRNAQGTLVTTDSLEVGGKKLGLSYADFGMWKTRSEFTGTTGGTPTTFATMNDPDKWTNGQDNKEAYFAAGLTGSAVYTGNAMGVVRAYSGYNSDVAAGKFHELYGSAAMTVNLAARTADLDLKFSDFYDFRFSNLGVADRDGDIDDDRATLTIQERNNNTGIHFAGTPGFDVDGQFYGPDRTNPTEVVGEAEIRQMQGGARVEADIVFGAKK